LRLTIRVPALFQPETSTSTSTRNLHKGVSSMRPDFAAFVILAIRVLVIAYILFLATRLVSAVEKIAER
jgi:hypothetical protein